MVYGPLPTAGVHRLHCGKRSRLILGVVIFQPFTGPLLSKRNSRVFRTYCLLPMMLCADLDADRPPKRGQ